MNKKPTVTISENRTELPELATLITGLLMANNYKETVTACEALLFLALERPVTVVRRGDRIRVLLNTSNRRTLAMGIVDEIRHYFGTPGFAPANTADPDIIVERATAWAQAQPDAINDPQEYSKEIIDAVNKLFNEKSFKKQFSGVERDTIAEKVQDWIEKKWEQTVNAQPLNDEQPGDPAPSVSDDQPGTPKAIDENVFKLLPDLYELLVEEGVVSGSLTKVDFCSCIPKGEVPDISKNSPRSWVLAKYKFKHTIKVLKRYFNPDWYVAVCSSANLDKKNMAKYNGQELEVFKRKLQKIGLK